VVATAGDRRDEDMRELGAVAADHFDILVVREDTRLRGRAAGETARLVEEGARAAMAAGARCHLVEQVLDELEASRHALDVAAAGDLVVLCADSHAAVWSEIQQRSHRAQPGTRVDAVGDPDL
jgi:cyanophycin synthetase